jgi:hypothetical protein
VENEESEKGKKYSLLVPAVFFFIIKIAFVFLLAYLIVYQTYLMSVNLTFWEFKRWKFINYLKDLNFSQINKKNIFIQKGSSYQFWLFFFKATFQKA